MLAIPTGIRMIHLVLLIILVGGTIPTSLMEVNRRTKIRIRANIRMSIDHHICQIKVLDKKIESRVLKTQ